MRTASGPPTPPTPIFGTDVSDEVPGELLVRLRDETAFQITENIPSGPTRGDRSLPSAFGVEDLDDAMDQLQVTSVVRLFPPVSPVDATSASVVSLTSTFRIRYEGDVSSDAAVQMMSEVAGVEFAEPNRYRETYQVTPNDPSFAAQWGLNRINCPAAWSRTTGSANVTVAVIDTGIDLDHPELASLLVAGQDLVDLGTNPIPPAGFRFEGDFVGRDNNPQDEVGHGTHVAGTIACLSNNSVGVAGVSWSSRLMPVRVLARIVNNADASDVRGVGSAADIAAGIRWAVDHGAMVLNLSLGGTTDTQVERDAIAYAVSRGVVVVAAMGNDFTRGNPTSYPAAYPNVIAVGAIDQSDQRAFFSQTGPHIDVAAPGVGVLSTVWDNGYATYNGTSMAAPHVAGVAALILSCNASLTATQVGDIIRQTAQPLRDNAADPVPNNNYGHGCVDAEAALNRACPRVSVPIIRCPSVIQRTCPQISVPIIRCPSVIQITCPQISVPIIRCPSVIQVTCPQISVPIVRCPSVAIRCPSETIRCPSLSSICPSGPVCGIDQPIDPVIDPFGITPQDWEDLDPYSLWYDDSDESGLKW